MAFYFFLEEGCADGSTEENLNQLRILDSKDTDNCYHERFTENVIPLVFTIFNSRTFTQLEENYLLRNKLSVSLLSLFPTCQVSSLSSLRTLGTESRKPDRLVIENRRKNVQNAKCLFSALELIGCL